MLCVLCHSTLPRTVPTPRKLKAPCGQEPWLSHETKFSPGHGRDIPTRLGLPQLETLTFLRNLSSHSRASLDRAAR